MAACRLVLRNPSTGEESVVFLSPEQEKDSSHFRGEGGVDLEVADRLQLTEWLATNYKNFGATLEFVTDRSLSPCLLPGLQPLPHRSQEGSQFQKGFGGLGGILRYKMDFNEFDAVVDDNDEEFI